MFQQTLRSILAVILVPIFAVAGHAQFGGESKVNDEGQKLDHSYHRLFLVRYDPELLPLSPTLLAASAPNELIERALVTVEKHAQTDRPHVASKNIGDRVYFRCASGYVDGSDYIIQNSLVFTSGQNLPQGTIIGHLGFECTSDVDLETRKQIWRAVVTELETLWRNEQQKALKQRQDRRNASLQPLRRKREEATAELERTMHEYIELQVSTGTSTDHLREALQNASSDRRRIEMELSGEDATREALEHRIAMLRKEAGAAVEEDKICRELKKIVELQESAIEIASQMHKAAQVPLSAVDAAKTESARARVEYLRARHQASRSAGAEELAALNRELADLNMQTIKQKAILQATARQAEELKVQLAEQLRAEMRMDSMQQQIDLLKNQIAAISERIAEMELEEETVQPLTITPWGE